MCSYADGWFLRTLSLCRAEIGRVGRLCAGQRRETITRGRGLFRIADCLPPSPGTGGPFRPRGGRVSEPSTVPTGPAGASLPATSVMIDSPYAWQHHCGHVNIGEYLAFDVCEGCLHDTVPADVVRYSMVTVPNTILAPPERTQEHERARLRRCAARAPMVLPGVVGETLARDLLAWHEFGYRFGSHGLIRRLLDDIEKRSIPEPKK